MVELQVELYGQPIGRLVGNDWRDFYFDADIAAVEEYGIGSIVLSEAIPLLVKRNRANAKRERNFFAELLPEGAMLTRLALRARANEQDVISLLSHYGRDVAGALQVWDTNEPGEPRSPYSTPVTGGELEVLLSDTSIAPLGNRPDSGKSSLAGVYEKVVLASVDGAWHTVHDGFASTHILKPEVSTMPTLIFDEEYGCRLARLLGLAQHSTEVCQFGSVNALVVQRYDRTERGRLHHEDMNQALGARGNEKYQEHGGKVTLARIAATFARRFDERSMTMLLRMHTLSVAIGNLDMHAKNISTLHFKNGGVTIAPMYDVVPMTHLNTDGKMALATNGIYEHRSLSAGDIVHEGQSWGLQNANAIVGETLEEVKDLLQTEAPHPSANPHLVENLTQFVGNLLAGKRIGTPKRAD
jgi:serine/threonine-protein kinase HipA